MAIQFGRQRNGDLPVVGFDFDGFVSRRDVGRACNTECRGGVTDQKRGNRGSGKKQCSSEQTLTS